MKTQETKKRVNLLHEKCIEEVNKHFSLFIIEEYIEKNIFDFVITDEDWYNYWLEQASEIDDLVNRIQNSNKKDISDDLIELVYLKSIVDKKLLDLKDEIQIRIDLGLEFDSPSTLSDIVSEPIKSQVMHSVYLTLCEQGLVEMDYQDFKSNF